MEPPGQRGGPVLAFADVSHYELIYDEEVLAAIGMDMSLASRGYVVAARLGYLVVGLLRAGRPELLPFHVMQSPRQWVPIWPPHGHRNWPWVPLEPAVSMGPPPVWIGRPGPGADG
jgi:hypothetical protein